MAKQSLVKTRFNGSWQIVSKSAWEDNYFNQDAPAFIQFDAGNKGSFKYGYVQGQMYYRTKALDGMRAVQFTWDGEGGAGGTPVDGIGWATLEGDELKGRICIHLGDESEFVARRVKEKVATNPLEQHPATELPKLKLGKGSAFVKTHLKQLVQQGDSWEADFVVLPQPKGRMEAHFLGLVVALPKGHPLVCLPLEYTPNVNDLADLLADAMRHPMTDSAHRPRQLLLRANPDWDELLPHLKQLGIEVSIQDELPRVDEVCGDFLRQMRRATCIPLILYTPSPTDVQKAFPAIAMWVHSYGRIEIGDQAGFGVVARALDYGGLVFEDHNSSTLAEAMAALEKGLARWFKKEGIEET